MKKMLLAVAAALAVAGVTYASHRPGPEPVRCYSVGPGGRIQEVHFEVRNPTGWTLRSARSLQRFTDPETAKDRWQWASGPLTCEAVLPVSE